MELNALADMLRLCALPALAWAAWTDWRERRVYHVAWIPVIVLGLAALGLDLQTATNPATYLADLGRGVGVAAAVGVLMVLVGSGKADLIAMVCVSLLAPTLPFGESAVQTGAVGVLLVSAALLASMGLHTAGRLIGSARWADPPEGRGVPFVSVLVAVTVASFGYGAIIA